MEIDITLSTSAAAYIKKMLAKENGTGFRLTIKKTGCSGFSYAPSIVNDVNPNDRSFVENGIPMFVDMTWLHLMQGLVIDYIEEDKAGIKQKKLMFTNPNEASRCGCGESFHVE